MVLLFGFPRTGYRRITFEDFVQKFMLARDCNNASYWKRWRDDGESLEVVLFDYLVHEIPGRPKHFTQQFNQLINALIVFLEGGDPTPYLEADPEDLLASYSAEFDQLQEISPGTYKFLGIEDGGNVYPH